jgi:hypothetical protein
MGFNDFLERSIGIRVVRASHLDELAPRRFRRDTVSFHQKAFAALKGMESNGKTLSRGIKRTADEYAASVLGSVDYAPWLYVYATMQGQFREGWMPDNFYQLLVVPQITKGLAEVTDMKSFSNIVLGTEALPDLAYHIDGVFYDRNYAIIAREQLREIARPHGKLFIKRDGGGNGADIQIVAADDLPTHTFTFDCVLQRPIRQHEFFDAIVTGSVATLRVTTAKAADGSVSARSSRLRVGRANSEWVQSGKQVQVAVDMAEGKLGHVCFTPDWREWAAHPDTGFRFSGARIPHFDKAAALALSLHAKIPHVPMIGWDLAINREGGVDLIEWNGGYCGVKFCEAMSGPHYRDMGWERFAAKAPV